jgi:hypothetical protein
MVPLLSTSIAFATVRDGELHYEASAHLDEYSVSRRRSFLGVEIIRLAQKIVRGANMPQVHP